MINNASTGRYHGQGMQPTPTGCAVVHATYAIRGIMITYVIMLPGMVTWTVLD